MNVFTPPLGVSLNQAHTMAAAQGFEWLKFNDQLHAVLDNLNQHYRVSPCHIDDLCVGDTVLRNGELVTVSASNLHWSFVMGRTLCGDSYRLGAIPVLRVLFNRPEKNRG